MYKCGLIIFTVIPRQRNDSTFSNNWFREVNLCSRRSQSSPPNPQNLGFSAGNRKFTRVHNERTTSSWIKNNLYCTEVRIRIYRTTRWFLEMKLKRASASDRNPSCEKAFPKSDSNMFCCFVKITVTWCHATAEEYDSWRYLLAVPRKIRHPVELTHIATFSPKVNVIVLS